MTTTRIPAGRHSRSSLRSKLTGLAAGSLIVVSALTGTAQAGTAQAGTAGDRGPAAPAGSVSRAAASSHTVPVPTSSKPHGMAPAGRGKATNLTTPGATSAGGDTYSKNYLVNQRNGYIQTDPRVYLIYWGDWSQDSYGVMNRLYNFYRGIGGSSWGNVMTQYQQGCTPGTWNCTGAHAGNPAAPFKSWYKDTSAVPTTPTQAQIAAEAQRMAINVFHDYNYNAQYVVALPRGHGDTEFKAGQACAWHYWTQPTTSSWVTYTALPYQPDSSRCYANTVNAGTAGYLDGVTLVAGHEYAETVTDPGVNAWYETVTNGQAWENGDKCSGYGRNVTLSSGTFPMQPTWSNYYRYYYGTGCRYSA